VRVGYKRSRLFAPEKRDAAQDEEDQGEKPSPTGREQSVLLAQLSHQVHHVMRTRGSSRKNDCACDLVHVSTPATGDQGTSTPLQVELIILREGSAGKAIVPGKAKDSLLYKLLSGPTKVGGREIPAMPKAMGGESSSLPPEKIELIRKWIDQGAR
jgi:hypothetical protein